MQIGANMSMSDCDKCWNTPCDCGWSYRKWTPRQITEQIDMLNRVQEWLRLNQQAQFTNWPSVENMYDEMFEKEVVNNNTGWGNTYGSGPTYGKIEKNENEN